MAITVPSSLAPEKLVFTENPLKGTVPEKILWGGNFTDHMLTIRHLPQGGWAAPEIGPYGNISISPASTCLQYAQQLFEGMKAYRTPTGQVQLFRPDKNMERMRKSAARLTLPDFNGDDFITLLKQLVKIDERFVPEYPMSLYMRPTMIGTRPTLGMTPSDDCMMYCIMCPVDSFFAGGKKGVSVVSLTNAVRAWPGGTGAHKLGLNYGSGLDSQGQAMKLGYDMTLWANYDEVSGKTLVTECGGMNIWVVHKSDDGVTHLITAPLNGLVLPGVTRDSILELMKMSKSGEFVCSDLPTDVVVEERDFYGENLTEWSEKGQLLEVFGSGTAAVICPVERIGLMDAKTSKINDLIIPTPDDGFASGFYKVITGIQYGKIQGPAGWQVVV